MSESLFWRQGAGVKFLRSCSAVTGALNLAGLGAGRTGFGSNEMNPLKFTSQVITSIISNTVKVFCKLVKRRN